MNKTELINKLLWLGYTSAEEGAEKRKEAISTAHNLVDEYLEAINYTRCCTQLKDIEENNIEIKTLGDLKRVYPEGKLHTVNGYGKIINYSVDGEIVYTRHL